MKTLPGSSSVAPQCRDRWRWTLPTFEVDWTKTGSSSCRRPENFCHLLGKLKNTNLVKFGLCWSGNYIWNRGFDYNWPFNQLQEIFFEDLSYIYLFIILLPYPFGAKPLTSWKGPWCFLNFFSTTSKVSKLNFVTESIISFGSNKF